MKARNHTLLGLATAMAFGAPIVGIFGAVSGSLLPDKIDFKMSLGSERIFLSMHRGFSHWPWLYVAGIFAILLMPSARSSIWGVFLSWLFFGALIHVVCDMMTPGGVPFLPWSIKKKGTLKLFKTGTLKEYMYTWAMAVPLMGLGVYRIYSGGLDRYLQEIRWIGYEVLRLAQQFVPELSTIMS